MPDTTPHIHTIYLYPKDPLFFRDGRPFSMGEDTNATLLFPPMPSVFYGALRGLIAAHNGSRDGKEAAEMTKNVVIHSINLWYSEQAAPGSVGDSEDWYASSFPLPLDVVIFKNDNHTSGLQFCSKQGQIDSSKFADYQLKASKSEKTNDADGFLIKKTRLAKYLSNGSASFEIDRDLIKLSDYSTTEAKIGIGRDRATQTTAQSKLYSMSMLRTEWVEYLRDKTWTNRQLCFAIAFSIGTESITLPETGFVKLGADGKIAQFSRFDRLPTPIAKPKFTDGDQFFKLYLATPAIWDNKPDIAIPNPILNDSTSLCDIADMVVCAVGKPIYVGGFDMATNQPKTMQRAVPAGSVYYFKLKKQGDSAKQLNRIVEQIHNTCISAQRANEGFGMVFIGKVDTQFLNP